MTLQQLKYIVCIAKCGSISEAARSLFIAQPSLTAAVHELEQELGITIFKRTNKGVILSADGEEFLGYARQVIDQTNLIEEKYTGKAAGKHLFCVSTQHYSFAVEAFVDLLKDYGGEEYDFRIRETQTYEIIEDVAKLRSEVGVLYLNQFNETILRKTLRAHDLTFHRLFSQNLMYLSAPEVHWRRKKELRWKIWLLFPGFPTNRANTIPSIFPRKS